MKKRFILLVDFSAHSKHLLSLVHAWGKKVNAEILLIHQVMNAAPALGDTEVVNNIKQDQREAGLQELIAFSRETIGADSTIQFLADTTHLVSMLENLDSPGTVDYIFLGINEKTVVDRLLLGSTVSEITKQFDKIIIAFPTLITDISMEKLYIGVKEKYPLNEDAFQNLIAIIKNVVKELQFVSSLKPGENHEDAEKYLESLLDRYDSQINSSYRILKDERQVDIVKEYIISNKAVLVLQKGSRDWADTFRMYWTTEMINEARIPIIILPNK